jgi:hypothetical protein
MMQLDIQQYNLKQTPQDQLICELLAQTIDQYLPESESKIWHAHPVWFLNGNPIVGYSKLKKGIRLLFWSGLSFEETALQPGSGKFKDAAVTYTEVQQITMPDLIRWLQKSKEIQWDYKNIVKRKGILERL